MDYVYMTFQEERFRRMHSMTRMLIDAGYSIRQTTQKYLVIGTLNGNSGMVFKTGDTIWFVSFDSYHSWCMGRTYAFVAEPYKIYRSGYLYRTIDEKERLLMGKKTSTYDYCTYSKSDVDCTYALCKSLDTAIKRVIFHDPATIVIWGDNTKTVVKCQNGDVFDKEKGLALCIAKKYLGNKSNFNNEFRKWIK